VAFGQQQAEDVCFVGRHHRGPALNTSDTVTVKLWRANSNGTASSGRVVCHFWCTSTGHLPHPHGSEAGQAVVDRLVASEFSVETFSATVEGDSESDQYFSPHKVFSLNLTEGASCLSEESSHCLNIYEVKNHGRNTCSSR
jgi:hypothetical protein